MTKETIFAKQLQYIDNLPLEYRQVLSFYTGDGFEEINEYLRQRRLTNDVSIMDAASLATLTKIKDI